MRIMKLDKLENVAEKAYEYRSTWLEIYGRNVIIDIKII